MMLFHFILILNIKFQCFGINLISASFELKVDYKILHLKIVLTTDTCALNVFELIFKFLIENLLNLKFHRFFSTVAIVTSLGPFLYTFTTSSLHPRQQSLINNFGSFLFVPPINCTPSARAIFLNNHLLCNGTCSITGGI